MNTHLKRRELHSFPKFKTNWHTNLYYHIFLPKTQYIYPCLKLWKIKEVYHKIVLLCTHQYLHSGCYLHIVNAIIINKGNQRNQSILMVKTKPQIYL